MSKLYIIGISILIVAIIANIIATKIGLESWYGLIELLQSKGINSLSKLTIWDYLWLIILYPFTLSLGYYIGQYINDYFFK